MTEDDLLSFITSSIGSVWALELLLLLKRDPGRGWDPGALILELRSSPSVIEEALQRLQGAGLAMQNGGGRYRYHAAAPHLDDTAAELEKLYATKPMAVIKAIVTAHTDKLRASSDAFKLTD